MRFHDDDGMISVFTALILTIILMFAALAIDGGQAYQSHRQSQNAADTGAMAGVNALSQLNFYPVCSATVPAPCTTFTTPSAIRSEIMRLAQNTGADTSAGGVLCYLLDGNGARSSGEICDSNSPPSNGTVAASSGVEVKARMTKQAYFSGVSGVANTKASTTAKAFIYNFVGGTGSPFIMCGTRDTMPSGYSPAINWAYDILTKDNSTGAWKFRPGAVGSYYQVQGSQNPSCGAGSATFKGKGGDGVVIDTMPFDSPIITGNGFSNIVQISVAGITACPAGATTFNGCGMLIPIADSALGSGSSTSMHLVTWLAFQVWGSGNTYTFSGAFTDALGTSCGNPITPGGSMKFCGKLLGAVQTTAGAGSGPGTAGQPHVIRLSE